MRDDAVNDGIMTNKLARSFLRDLSGFRGKVLIVNGSATSHPS